MAPHENAGFMCMRWEVMSLLTHLFLLSDVLREAAGYKTVDWSVGDDLQGWTKVTVRSWEIARWFWGF